MQLIWLALRLWYYNSDSRFSCRYSWNVDAEFVNWNNLFCCSVSSLYSTLTVNCYAKVSVHVLSRHSCICDILYKHNQHTWNMMATSLDRSYFFLICLKILPHKSTSVVNRSWVYIVILMHVFSVDFVSKLCNFFITSSPFILFKAFTSISIYISILLLSKWHKGHF
jgi:hypothetical protein